MAYLVFKSAIWRLIAFNLSFLIWSACCCASSSASLAACALIKGFASDELNKSELDYHDKDYQIVISIVAKKGIN